MMLCLLFLFCNFISKNDAFIKSHNSNNLLISTFSYKNYFQLFFQKIKLQNSDSPHSKNIKLFNSSKYKATTQRVTAYDANQISVLEGLDPVRQRPGMYIGSTGEAGLHQLVWEIVDNSVDEVTAGYCTEIKIFLNSDDSVTIIDNGRGIPCDVHSQTGKSALETVLTVLHAGGKFNNEDSSSSYRISAGLHGVGLSVVNALSESLVAQVKRDGTLYEISFKKGLLFSPLKAKMENTTSSVDGTSIQFKADASIFKSNPKWSIEKLMNRFNEITFLNPNLSIEFVDRRTQQKRVGSEKMWSFQHKGGLTEYMEMLCEKRQPLHKVDNTIQISGEAHGVAAVIVLRWNDDVNEESIISYANGVKTTDGGTHTEGLKIAITKALNTLFRRKGLLKQNQPNLQGEYIREGLTAIIAVKLTNAEFESQTKSRLGNPEVRAAVEQIISLKLSKVFEWNFNGLSSIYKKSIASKMAAAAAKATKELERKRSSLHSSIILPGKLADCSSQLPEDREIFIVEGDSAAGSAKMGRDRRTQAILPLRGKILNVEKAANDQKMYENSELKALITSLGLPAARSNNPSKPYKNQLRYNRILIMTDADVDGEHIRLLLLTFFYRYYRYLLEEGYIYIACSPLYKVTHPSLRSVTNKRVPEVYAWSDEELRVILNNIELAVQSVTSNKRVRRVSTTKEVMSHMFDGVSALPTGVSIQRFKGLGEMMADQLWDTTMNPETRYTKQMIIQDAKEADRLVTMLMGEHVFDRKQFITNLSEKMKLSDLDY